jgi:hypothetical protein
MVSHGEKISFTLSILSSLPVRSLFSTAALKDWVKGLFQPFCFCEQGVDTKWYKWGEERR